MKKDFNNDFKNFLNKFFLPSQEQSHLKKFSLSWDELVKKYKDTLSLSEKELLDSIYEELEDTFIHMPGGKSETADKINWSLWNNEDGYYKIKMIEYIILSDITLTKSGFSSVMKKFYKEDYRKWKKNNYDIDTKAIDSFIRTAVTKL